MIERLGFGVYAEVDGVLILVGTGQHHPRGLKANNGCNQPYAAHSMPNWLRAFWGVAVFTVVKGQDAE